MNKPKHRVDELAAEVAALRAELAALRDGTGELHVRRIVVEGDGDPRSEITPGQITVTCEPAHTTAGISADWEQAGVYAWSSDRWFSVPGPGWDELPDECVGLTAVNPFRGTRRAFVEVNGVELPVPVPAP